MATPMAGARLVRPLSRPPDAIVPVPGSKSITNRALVCAALADGTSELRGVGRSDDTEAMAECITRLGATVAWDVDDAVVLVMGTGGRLRDGPVELDARLAGTTSRFITALAALGHGRYRVDGAPPLRARPMGPLHDALAALGVPVRPEGEPGHLPVELEADGLRGGTVTMPGDVSSQFVTALMLVAPEAAEGITIELATPLVSRPYVRITAETMAVFGVDGVLVTDDRVVVPPGRYRATRHTVEPDASSASYLWAAAAITGGRVLVPDFPERPWQGDVAFVDLLGRMGAEVERLPEGIAVTGRRPLHGIDADLADLSDTVPTLAAVACFAASPTRITGVGFIRAKETDRIGSLVRELRRCGADAVEEPDGLRITPAPLHGAPVRTYHDHRMAMALALLGLVVPGVEIEDPDVVGKSFPGFWAALERLEPSPGRPARAD
jgi:3-phosphoshikimate 1-carboxyvinyltransferase